MPLYLITHKWKQPKCPSTCEYPHNGTLLSNRNELPIYATTWMNLKRIILNERIQNQKTTYYIFPYMTFWKSGCHGLRVGERHDFNGHKLILRVDRTIVVEIMQLLCIVCQHSRQRWISPLYINYSSIKRLLKF